MIIYLKNKQTLQVDDFYFKCCIGKKGLTFKKREGDQKTPKGIFQIENLYYREDRIEKPQTQLKCVKIKKDIGWCDDVNFENKYNKLFKIKQSVNQQIRYEKLSREDHKLRCFKKKRFSYYA